MSDRPIKLRQGFTISLAGRAAKQVAPNAQPETFALKPTDFIGMYRPKLLVNQGDAVKAGTPLFFDKGLEAPQYCAPVSGEVAEIVRGEKRKLLEIRILADKEIEYEPFERYTKSELGSLTRQQAQEQMLRAGVWPNIVQRPFGVVANPADTPKNIFISCFDTHPLAPDYEFLLQGQAEAFAAGVTVLKKFTSGEVHVSTDADAEVSQVFTQAKDAKQHSFSGKHPAGNVGVHIHHIAPINKDEVVWTVNPYGVAQIGKLFLEGKYDASKLLAIAGSELKEAQYVKTFVGARLDAFIKNNLNNDHVRVISGNVLTGEAIAMEGYLGFYDNLVSVLPEGDRPRFFLTEGWLAPVSSRLSYHRALGLLSFLNGKKEYRLDTSTNGEERAFVMTGAFEDVVPMDVMPTHLLKAIMAEDYDEMEALGILEVVEEDFALCEFIDVSKHPVQKILRKGLDMMREG